MRSERRWLVSATAIIAVVVVLPLLASAIIVIRNSPVDSSRNGCVREAPSATSFEGLGWSWRDFGLRCRPRYPDGRTETIVYR